MMEQEQEGEGGSGGVPECVVCLQAYDATHNIPRVLSCGHSLCECCISTLSAQDAESRSQRPFLRCPECNQRSKLPVTGPRGLPKNIELLRCIQSGTGSTAKAEGSATNNQALENARRMRFRFYCGPSFLYEGSLSELCRWIIPQHCVRLPEGSHRLQLDHVLSADILISLDENQRHIYAATFVPVETVWSSTNFQTQKVSDDVEYCERIRLLLELLTRPQRTDLFHLLRISALHGRVGTIFGFWMSAEGHLYLVCKAPAKESHYLRQISNSRKTIAAGKSISGLPDAGKEVGQLRNTRFSNSFLKRGKEMCELLMGLHGEGLVAGIVTPCCLGLTEFYHLSLDINALLRVRNSLKAYVKSQFTVTSAEYRLPNMTHPGETVKTGETEKPWLLKDSQPMIEGSYFHYASPELLSSLGGFDSFPHSNITSKTDSWTLGCLLCNLLSGDSPWDNLSLQDFLQKPLNGMRIAESWMAERTGLNLVGFNASVLDTNDWSMDFVRLLARCFADIPEDRPDIIEIWHFVHCVETSLDFECDSDLMGQYRDFRAIEDHTLESLWCLALECNLNTAREDPTEEHATSKTPYAGVPQMPDVLSQSVEDDVKSLDGHSAYVTSLVVCGQYLVSASFDKSICVWSLKDAALIKTLKGHAHRVMALAADRQSLLCVSGDYGGEICVWDLEAATLDYLKKWYDHQDWRYSGVASLAVSTDYFLYSGSGDKTIKVWSLQDYSLVATMEGHKSLVSALLIDTEVLYSGSWDGTIRLWWRNDHSPLTVLGESLELDAVRSLAISTEFLLAGYHSGKIQVWRDEVCLKSVVAHDEVISTLCLDEDALFSGSWDGNIKAWKVRELLDDATPRVVEMCGSAVTSLACHNGKLYAGLATKSIVVKRLQTIC